MQIDFESDCLGFERFSDQVLVMTLDMPASAANVLTEHLKDELDRALDWLETFAQVKGLVIQSAKPRIYIAGADLVAINSNRDWTDEQIIAFCDRGRTIYSRLSLTPLITVAAIHGACVGGGLELTLWCDGRIAANERSTLLGLPEVKLGLVPGWAGTVRLPRLIGLEPALELITSGELIDAGAGQQLGIVHQLVERDRLLDASAAWIDAQAASGEFRAARERGLQPLSLREADISKMKARIDGQIEQNTNIHPSAPRIVAEHMISAAGLPAREAYASEARAMIRVWGSESSVGLLNSFFLSERAKRQFKALTAQPPPRALEKIGFLGTGVMGFGIASLTAAAGLQVVLYDANSDNALSAAEMIENQVQQTNQGQKATVVSHLDDLAECDLVLENVVENESIKRQILGKLSHIVGNDIVIATNTSAIPLSAMIPEILYPERFSGMHFCNPVERMPLVEIVRHDATAPSTIAQIAHFARRIGKTPVAMNDSPGFIVNRILGPMLNQGIDLLATGCTAAEIDSAAHDFGFAAGPLEILDIIGLDTSMYAGQQLMSTYPNCVTASPILPRLVKLKRLGRKSLVGFHKYDRYDSETRLDDELQGLIQEYCREPGTRFSSRKLQMSLLIPMLFEAARAFDESIVDDARDIDFCTIHGFAFPDHRGGILFWADNYGIDNVLNDYEQVPIDRDRIQIPPKLIELAATGEKFYAENY